MSKLKRILAFSVKTLPLKSYHYKKLRKDVKAILKTLQGKGQRKPHVKVAYFRKQKTFFDHFWKHLLQKRIKVRIQRLKIFPCAIELLESSKYPPLKFRSTERKDEIFYRFFGKTKNDQFFVVQIKERVSAKKSKKQIISIFPIKNLPPGGSSETSG